MLSFSSTKLETLPSIITRITLMSILILLMVISANAQFETQHQITLDDLFPTDRLLDIQISLANKDWDTIRFQQRDIETEFQEKRKFKPITPPYTYVEGRISIDGVTFPRVGIRKKGFIGSQNSTRPSLKIKLNHVNIKEQIEGLTNLTLNNNHQDNSLMSQLMSYALFNAAGSPAPRCSYAKVTVNGRYLGVYCHVETVRQPFLKRKFGSDQGVLYEGTVVDFFPNWSGSFENKLGQDDIGRQKIKQLIQAIQGEDGEVILSSKATGRAWVPTDDRYDQRWKELDFDDSNWTQGQNGAGYEQNSGYQDWISPEFDFKTEMYNQTNSLYLRFPFAINNLPQIVSKGKLVLKLKYDDGAVAYLNGHRVASLNAPPNLNWTSKATASHEAMGFEWVDISAHKDKLRPGKNLLAIQGLNTGTGSSDMLIVAQLELNNYDYRQAISEFVDLDSFYTFWAMEGLLGFWDGYSANRNNFFFYLNPETDKFHFIPWGADCLFEKFSRLGERGEQGFLSVKTQGLIAHQLYQIESCRRRYAQMMQHILDNYWDEEKLLAETKRLKKLIEPHLTLGQKWNLKFGNPTNLNKVRDFIRHRRSEIMTEIADGMPTGTGGPQEPPFIKAEGMKKRTEEIE